MKKQEISFVNQQKKVKVHLSTVHMVRQCIRKVLEVEGLLDIPHEVSVTFVCNAQIRRINRQFRQVDSATDVLSFPVLEYDEAYRPLYGQGDVDWNEDGAVMLGDIVISVERCRQQAEEFGHSLRREIAYLTVHSMYHLLGYDHMKEDEKRLMRQKEEHVLSLMGITRE